ncbi:mechanosensitive ion channel protein MscS [Lysobacteraceae bacterium NML120232]|nr:mechanosensitive ion channel protein MscS [Xanthomonadaceae bacterium NML08-0793]PJK12741.1 mechanosensitive ion channel protein MscS [Xanthomonadaceae bacterium NML120232]
MDWKSKLPPWLQAWYGEFLLIAQIVLILVVALLLRWVFDKLLKKLSQRYDLPVEVRVGTRRILNVLLGFGTLLLMLERLGVSGGVLWTAFTGFTAVAAVAFFAAWSVLTNIFCALLLLMTRPFRLHDHIELMEGGDRPGLRGKVVDMNLIYVTLLETHPKGGESHLRIPNSLFFQRSTRRWLSAPEALEYPPASHRPSAAPPAGGGSML